MSLDDFGFQARDLRRRRVVPRLPPEKCGDAQPNDDRQCGSSKRYRRRRQSGHGEAKSDNSNASEQVASAARHH